MNTIFKNLFIFVLIVILSVSAGTGMHPNPGRESGLRNASGETAEPSLTAGKIIPGDDSLQANTVPVQEADEPIPAWNAVIGLTEISLVRSSGGESTMNNLICDAMLWKTGTDFAFINFGDIYTDFETGNISHLDLFRLIPFDRTLVIIEIPGRLLQEIMEFNLSGVRQGMAIAGGKVECDFARPNFHRLNSFQVGAYPCYPLKDYRVATTDYLLLGNAGFSMLTTIEPGKIQRTEVLLRDAIGDYIRTLSPLNPVNVKVDGRWEKRIAPQD